MRREPRNVVAVGASAGGVEALQQVVAGLHSGFQGTMLVVLHLSPGAESRMPEILSRADGLPAVHPEDGEPSAPGRIYVARPDLHLEVSDGRIRVSRGPRENRHRPSIDVLFRSVARVYGARAIGVLLTGSDDDGAAGMAAIKRAGGLTVVQDPEEAPFPEMPGSALRLTEVDHVLEVDEIGPCLLKLSKEMVEWPPPGGPREEPVQRKPEAFGCPECGGPVLEVVVDGAARLECAVGHRFSYDALLEADDEAVERALWAAARALEESAAVLRKLAAAGGSAAMREYYEQRAHGKQEHARVIRRILAGEPLR